MLKDYLKEQVEYLYEEGYEFYDLPYELFGEKVKNWPEVASDPDEPNELEPLDMENFEIISIDDDSIVVACGGDWQEPRTLTIELVEGVLTVTNVADDEFSDGMDENEFLESIGIETSEEKEDTEEDEDEDY